MIKLADFFDIKASKSSIAPTTTALLSFLLWYCLYCIHPLTPETGTVSSFCGLIESDLYPTIELFSPTNGKYNTLVVLL